jgi:hypothetical protein
MNANIHQEGLKISNSSKIKQNNRKGEGTDPDTPPQGSSQPEHKHSSKP